MSHPNRALIRWIPREQGGRTAPPVGPSYFPTARFEGDHPPDRDWSVVIRLENVIQSGQFWLAHFQFLADAAPETLIHGGSRFELMEGAKCVAKGVVMEETEDVPDHLIELEAALNR